MTEQNLTLRRIDIPVGFSRTLTNRMQSVFDRSQLDLIGGPLAKVKMKARHLMPALSAVTYLPSGDLLEDATFNGLVPKVAETLIAGNDKLRQESYIDAIGGADFTNLPQIAVDLATRGAGNAGIVFRTVFGATEEMPFRALSYLLPALVLQDDLRIKGIIPPQLQVVFANHLSAGINSMNYEQSKTQAELFSGIAQRYIRSFFPELTESVVFLEDKPLVGGDLLHSELARFSTFLEEDGGEEIKRDLVSKGFNSDLDASLRYGAAHLLFHDVSAPDLLAPLGVQEEGIDEPTTIINIGGRQEQFFYQLRQMLKYKAGISTPVRTLQLFTRHHVPPYYLAQGGDVSLETIIKGETLPTEIARTANFDLEYLTRESSKRGDFVAFVTDLQSQRRRR